MTQHHDPVHPDSGHLDVELVADLDAGLLDAESAGHAEHHLASCPDCAALRAQLAEVSALLAGLPPVPMPPEVADRIATALAAEPTPGRAAPAVLPQRREPARAGGASRWLSVAAVAAALVVVGALVVGQLVTPGGGSPGTEAAQTTTVSRSGHEYNPNRLRTDVVTLMSADHTLAAATPTAYETSQTPASQPSATASPGTATGSAVTGTALPTASQTTAAPLLAGDRSALVECVKGLTDGTEVEPVAADVGTWEGDPAVVVVLPVPGSTTQYDVWVVGPHCSSADAQLLYWMRLTRP